MMIVRYSLVSIVSSCSCSMYLREVTADDVICKARMLALEFTFSGKKCAKYLKTLSKYH